MLYFYNDGEIDIRAVTTLGVSVKETKNPIGFFGTGLKYSIAIILRLGGKIKIYSGLDEYVFSVEPANIRGSDFNIVKMNDRELGFTTDLGKTWEPWMVFRELYCNAKDEAGDISFSHVEPSAGKTVIVVNCNDVEDASNRKDEFLISDRRKVEACFGLEIYQKKNTSNCLFYRGIKVQNSSNSTLYDYNILKTLKLSEDRSCDSWSYEYYLKELIGWHVKDSAILENILTAPHDSYEGKFDFSTVAPSDTFLNVIENIIDTPLYGRINKSAIKVYYQYRKKSENFKSELISEYEGRILQKCLRILKYHGFDLGKFKIVCVTSLGDNILGQADPDQKIIYVAKEAFNRGSRTLLGTLYEEYAHLAFKYIDETRAFQNHLIDSFAGMLERTYQEENNESLSNSSSSGKNFLTQREVEVPF